jgi:hypothetical protein
MRRAAAVACLCLVLPTRGRTDPVATRVRVTATLANVRAEPSVQGKVIFQVKRGEELLVLGDSSPWLHVRNATGIEGFLKQDLVEPIAPPSEPTAPQASVPPSAGGGPVSTSGASAPSIDHQAVDCLLAGSHPLLDARFNPQDVAKPRVYFRADGTVNWYYVDMNAGDGGYHGILPKPQATTRKIDYYIEALGQTLVSGRTQEYGPLVVKRKSECDKKMIAAVAASAGKLVVGSDTAGAPPIPAGFEAAGIVVAGAAASTSAAAAVSGSSHTLLYVAGGAVAVGAVAVAAKGGGSSSSSPATDLGGTWTGPLTSQTRVMDPGLNLFCNVTQTATFHLSQSGSTITGTAAATVALGTCNLPFNGTTTGLQGTEALTGTASNGQISMASSNGGTFTGTYTPTSMSLKYAYTNVDQSIPQTITDTGTMTLTKQ